MKKNLSLIVLLLGVSFTSVSQGSRILAPNYAGTGSLGVPGAANDDFAWLEHDAFAATNFLDPGATTDERVYVHLQEGETLRFGVRRIPVKFDVGTAYSASTTQATNQDLTIVVFDNAGNIVQATYYDTDATSDGGSTLLTSNGSGTSGIIGSVAESLLGPEFTIGSTTYNPGGYDPREYTNNTGSDQDFYIAFLQDDYTFTTEAQLIIDINSATINDANIRSWYDLWDFTIYDQEIEQTGRLFCKRWGFTAQFLGNLYADEMEFFARIPSTINGFAGNYVKKIDIGGIEPFSSTLFANSTGTDLGSVADINGDGNIDFLDSRKSNADETIGALEYDIFLQNPDIDVYPTSTLPTVLIANAVISCSSTGGGQASIYFETNQIGEVSILVDLNGTAGYQDGTEDIIIEQQVTAIGSASVLWNGLDGLGDEVASGTTITISGRFTSGPLHVPMGDVENAPTGINIEDVRPSTSFNLIYWDDESPAAITDASPSVNLSGSNTNRHIWTGETGDGDLINTWSFGYYQVNTEVISFNFNCDLDGDGVPNDLDEDADNDGISNSLEGDPDADADADGIPNYLDTDFAGFTDNNGDGINDAFDADQDGVINAFDLDSDNDGIPDVIEVGLADTDNDGQFDSFPDANNNGLNDNDDPDPNTRVDTAPDECVFVDGQDHLLVFNTSTVDEANPALGDVTLSFGLVGDYDNGTDENFTLTLTGEGTTAIIDDGDLNGEYIDTDSNEGTYAQCDETPMTFTITIPRADWNTFNDDGVVNITVGVNAAVGNFCTDNIASCISDVRVTYLLDNAGGTPLTLRDTDQDGIDDYLDIDSDNDGIVDVIEAGGSANSSTGTIASFTDSNGNGWNDNEEIFALPLTNSDTDVSGTIEDYRDIDSDDDGITDNREGQNSQVYVAPDAFTDTDGDGLSDIYDPNNGGTFISPVNSDGTGDPDYQDIDADDDGVADVIEGFDDNKDGRGDWDATGSNNLVTDETNYNVDADGDGLRDVFDTDGGGAASGIGNVTASNASHQNTENADNADWQDTDDDNDGILTSGEDDNGNGDFSDDRTQGQNGGSSPPDYLFDGDYDNDGIADTADLDSDNDGILDVDEDGGTGFDPSGDEDGDGILNYEDNNDATIIGSIGAFVDVNSDGVDDRFDKDQDAVPDFLDSDSDNDGVYDTYEANNGVAPTNFNDTLGQFNLDDPDNDGLMNAVDNNDIAPTGVSTLPKGDFDSDGIDDYLDLDSDNDGIPDNVEFQAEGVYIAPSENDSDGDGLDDAYDSNNGGTFISPTNTDGGGEPDYRDEDSDDDNVLDRVEGSDADNNGFGDWDDNTNGLTDEGDYSADSDNDGIVDAFDNVATIDDVTNITGSSAALQNTDGLDNRDWRDTNDDNDNELTANEDANLNGEYTDDRTDGQGGGSSIPDYLFKGDTDGDGVADVNDSDSDNDGIPDTSEQGTLGVDPSQDADADGIPNFRDSDIAGFTDSNGDGVDDRGDKDLDGIPDFQDLDSDNDGIPDAVEANNGVLPANMDANGTYPASYVTVPANDPDEDGFPVDVDPDDGGTALANLDHDGDGINDYLDLDSDNDGLTDLVEVGGTDADGDGRRDGFTDIDNNGIDDSLDPDQGGTALTYSNSDTDSFADYFDVDSDGDGIADATEQGGRDTDANGQLDDFTDTDNDGLADEVDGDNGGTALAASDPDGDGLPNYRDLDSDNDGLQDILEAGGVDADANGTVDGTFTDVNNNGYDDAIEASPLPTLDTDGDGFDNFADLDADNDGIIDVVEFGLTPDSGTGQINGFTDSNGNGWNDTQEGASITPANTDNASDPIGIADYVDLDSDDDGIVDNIEAQTRASYIAPSGNDSDNDGLDDAYDPDNGGSLITPVNTDANGNADYLDDDSDDDNVPDRIEGNNAGRGQFADWDTDEDGNFDDSGFNVDVDEDGILDIFDTFVGTGTAQVTGSNAAVQDTDVDGTSDFQDVDDDNDGTNTILEDDNTNGDPTDDFAAGGTPIPDYLFNDPDLDGDGISNSNDTDADNDGLANADEDGGTGVNPGGDNDEDGILNYQDTDIDGDGIANDVDSDADGDGVTDTFTLTDANGDGIFDEFDNDFDGVPDMIDRDSDNDGIADVIELGLTDLDENGQIDGPTDGAITDLDGNGMEDSLESDPIARSATSADDSQDVNDPSHTLTFNVSTSNVNADATLTFNLDGDYGGGAGANENFVLTGDGVINLGTFDETDSDQGAAYDDCGATMTFSITIPQADWNTMNDDGVVSIVFTTPNGGVDTGVCPGLSSAISNIETFYSINNPGGSALTPPDTDSDGVPNYLDLDSDNDGLSDNREAQATATYVAPVDADADGDGLFDVYDEDVASGNALAPVDADSGTDPNSPDYLDSDSDGDGLDDIIEGHDANSNGFADWDTDGDNSVNDETGFNTDFDGDGVWDIFDTDNSSMGIVNVTATNADYQDTDADSESDFRDVDDDGDGINTVTEDNNSNSNYTDDFTQGGGTEPDYLFVPDQDGDSVLDNVDGDSDNDGILNTDEFAGATYASGDAFGDNDADGIYNYLDTDDNGGLFVDTNGDGVDDRVDQDLDGVPNFFDLDSDNDGILDAIEANNGVVPADFDTNTGRFTSGDADGDGINSTVDDAGTGESGTPLTVDNFDVATDPAGAVLPDYLDLDSDNDGISDNQEGQGETRIEPSGVDANNDGWDDAYDGADAIVPVNTDVAVPTFGDSEPDYRDTDSDADSVEDFIEGFDNNVNGFADWDAGQDNNILTDEAGFALDGDGDGIVDLFDDFTGFGINNIDGTSASLQDTDGNGTRDWRDDDDDGDGVDTRSEDFNTNGILYDDKNQGGGAGPDYLFFADRDGDGVADNVSFDGDNDGIPNSEEIGGLQNPYNDGDADGIPAFQDSSETGFVDVNTDGIDDRYDFDLDGLPDFLDLDSDNDGIPDAVEANGGTRPAGMNSEGQYPPAYTAANDANMNGLVDDVEAGQGGTPLATPDSDGDGIDDYKDLDSDNDGIPDIVEAGGTDADNNGIIDAFGDTDDDGLANAVDVDNGGSAFNIEDLDGDGLPNYIDADSDNDGLSDLYEAGGTDTTNDGVADVLTDTDGDGWVDVFDSDDGGTALAIGDTDSDGNEDYRDLDSDNDAIPDAVERNGGTLPANMSADGEYTSAYVSNASNDSDTDGLYNDTDGTTPLIASTDGDGLVDHLDLDSDSDGIPDILEVNQTDSNNDGRIDSFVDTDGDGLADALDSDNAGTAATISNADGDSFLPDYRDIDADNDGIPDVVEVNGTDVDNDGLPANPTTDTDGDGWADAFDSNNGGTALTVVDIDGDGLFNFQDLDADNDGLSDILETDGTDANNDGLPADVTDTDGDGWPDSFDSDNAGTAYTYPDTDGDGRYNFADVDSDNDGLPDAVEANGGILPANMNADGQYSSFTDTDGDGYADDRDADNGGTLYADPNTDGPGDAIVDRLDFDSDNDGIPDAVEANGGTLPANMDSNGTYSTFNDSDFDGLHDDLDSDNGGTALANPNSDNGLTGGDTNRPDYIDLDSDGDGIVDIVEAGGADTDQDGVVDSFADTDGDGLADTVDPNNGGTALAYTDSDGDGTPNYADTDSDNDTVSDLIEAFDSNTNATTGGGTADGVSPVTPSGVDSDNDGIDDAFEGAIPTFQNTDGGGDVDWIDNDDDDDGIPTADENADVNPNNGIPDYLEPTTNPCGGSSVQVYPATGDLSTAAGTVDNINSAAGAPDAANAELYEDGDALQIDLQHFFAGGTGSYTITWKRRSGDGTTADLIIQESENPGGPFTQRASIPSTTDDVNYTVTVVTPAVNTRYIRLIMNTGTSGDADIDIDAVGICSTDADNDLVADRIDEDDDNDGIPDATEIAGFGSDPSGDDDVDGILNYEDPDIAGYVDSNADNINDNFDQDLDGIPNHLDLDSDNDGIPDAVEANGGSLPANMIANGRYNSSYIVNNDSDGDGLANDVDPTGGTPLANPDSDGDGNVDFLDLDSDNDGIPDLVEAGGTDADNNGVLDSTTDSDGDGLINLVDSNEGGAALTILNSDGDNLVNYRDGDSDNDGIPDIIEAGGVDTDGDGVADTGTDTDGDGWVDTFDSDNGGTAIVPGDADGDGFDNYVDLDSDNDGLPDALEANGGTLPANMDADGQYPATYVNANDTDGDGLANDVDTDNTGTALAVPNTDGTGGADYLDIDADNDGIPDIIEAGGTDANNDGTVDNLTDSDGDGIVDAFDPDNGGSALTISNPDGDGLPTYLDLDSDNDGIPDVVEMGGTDANGDGLTDNVSDNDGDGWSNTYDSDNGGTPFTEFDTDGDGLNNNEDLDSDSDGIADAYEANGGDLPAGMNADGQYTTLTDTDGDGLHDNVDTDNSGTALPVANTDGSGNADFADSDADGDGIPDYEEAFDDNEDGSSLSDFITRAENWRTASGQSTPYSTVDTDMDGVPDWLEDADGDGIPNYLDPDNATFYQDTDGDGIVDLHDPDNDGVAYGGISGQPDSDGNGTPNIYDNGDAVTLPVELLYFGGVFEDESVSLQWGTASEKNNDYFEIQKSRDGIEFTAIGEVQGNGSTDEFINYQFEDHNPVNGANYYRLRQFDFDGQFEDSNIIVVFAENTEFKIDVFPNPVSELLNIRFNGNVDQVSISLIDLKGTIVKRQVYNPELGENNSPINVSELNGGIHFLILSVNGEIEKRKIMIKH